MNLINYFAIYVILWTYSSNTKSSVGQYFNTTRYKRSVTSITEKTFKKESLSTDSFTKVGSTRLDYKTWPR